MNILVTGGNGYVCGDYAMFARALRPCPWNFANTAFGVTNLSE
jgi:hypothetical protein